MRNKPSYRTGKRERMLAKMAAMREAKERKRMTGPVADYGPQKVPAGMLLGVLQGARADQIRVAGCKKDHGFDWLTAGLRKKIAGQRRLHQVAPHE